MKRNLENLSKNNMVKSILDKSRDLTDVTEEVLSWWDINLDLYKRTPKVKYLEEIKTSDLDMSTVLFSLCKRNAVIKFPQYKSYTARVKKEGQELTSPENRHGKVVGVFSNKRTFSFGVRLVDANIMSSSEIGDYRNFLVLDYDGNWYSGWNYIDFIPTEQEKEFIDAIVNSDNVIYFDNFVHPNRWISLYGKYYFITKMLIDRLDEEARDYDRQIKNMLTNNIQPIEEERTSEKIEYQEDRSNLVPKTVRSLEVEVVTPEGHGEIPQYEHNSENLTHLIRKKRHIRNKIIPRLRFNTRATELAFFYYGYNSNNEEKMAGWFSNKNWERNFKKYRAKKRWDKLTIPQEDGSELGIIKRVSEVTERVREQTNESVSV